MIVRLLAITCLAIALTFSGRRASGQCVVHGNSVKIEDIVVSPPGHRSFKITIVKTAVDVTYGKRPGDVTLDVAGDLAFRGTVPDVPLRPIALVTAAHSTVRLSTSSRLTEVRTKGNALLAKVELAAGVSVSTLSLPCRDLTVDEPQRSLTNDTPLNGTSWYPKGSKLVLGSRPGGKGVVTIALEHLASLPLKVITRKGKQALVERTWSKGARIRGWVDQDAIHRTELFPGLGISGIGHGCCGTSGGCGAPHVFCGRAEVLAGTKVYAQPDSGQWATVPHTVHFSVRWVRSEKWAQITGASGITETSMCGPLSHAWISSTALVLP